MSFLPATLVQTGYVCARTCAPAVKLYIHQEYAGRAPICARHVRMTTAGGAVINPTQPLCVLQKVPVYLASGILSYNDTAAMQDLTQKLTPFASTIYYKELFLTDVELASMSADQRSVVDYLVLLTCERFVGINTSTYSWWVREYRKLMGYDTRTSLFVATPHVGTDLLFSSAAGLPSHKRIFKSAAR